jgi:signal transduction histidine kinase
MLEYSRLDAVPQEDHAPIDLDHLLRSVVADVAFEFGEAGADTRIDYAGEGGVSTVGYESALRSGIENVLRNAARHHRGDGSVSVRLDAEDDEAVITIEDHGGGVAEDEIARIFEPFYRATARPSSIATDGSGLGLSIAGRAIELNKGALSARNTERGFCVEIRLPVVAPDDGDPAT